MTHRTTSALHRSPAPDALTSNEATHSPLPGSCGLFGVLLSQLRFRAAQADEAVWLRPDDVAQIRNQGHMTWFRSSALGHPAWAGALELASTDSPRARDTPPHTRTTAFSQLRSAS